MAAEQNTILVLCQRKKTVDPTLTNKIITPLERLLATLVHSPSIKYLSPGMSDGLPFDVDYEMKLDDTSVDFVKAHRASFQAIVFQTCPITTMKNSIAPIYHLLQPHGFVVFTSFSKVAQRIIDLVEYVESDIYGFSDEFYRYFEADLVHGIRVYRKRSVIMGKSVKPVTSSQPVAESAKSSQPVAESAKSSDIELINRLYEITGKPKETIHEFIEMVPGLTMEHYVDMLLGKQKRRKSSMKRKKEMRRNSSIKRKKTSRNQFK